MPHFNWIFLLSAKPLSTVPMYADEIGLTNSEPFLKVSQRVEKSKISIFRHAEEDAEIFLRPLLLFRYSAINIPTLPAHLLQYLGDVGNKILESFFILAAPIGGFTQPHMEQISADH